MSFIKRMWAKMGFIEKFILILLIIYGLAMAFIPPDPRIQACRDAGGIDRTVQTGTGYGGCDFPVKGARP